MLKLKELTSDNFIIYAANNYVNYACISEEEFYSDVNRFKHVKKHVNRFLNETIEEEEERIFRLLLNHIVVICNVFEQKSILNMFLFKLDKTQLSVIKPILIQLKQTKEANLMEIPLNKKSIRECRKIKNV